MILGQNNGISNRAALAMPQAIHRWSTSLVSTSRFAKNILNVN
jgi:hypothetical protein